MVDDPLVVKSVEKRIKSKTTPIEEKLELIKQNVYKILGRYKDNTIVITTKQELIDYIDESIKNGIIAIDTETNNSLDPITCKLMGGCIYTPTLKQAYIPINHIDYKTGQRLDWQLTEQDIKEQFDRLSNTKIIMHNAKFDYEVIKCTCNCKLKVYWDTMIGAKLLDENERAGLKQQYIEKIDSSVEKYDIEHLFNIEYAVVNPLVFALYAATDAMMTYKLYLYQQNIFNKKGNEKLLSLMMNIEMPVMEVAAEMELVGVDIDEEYAQRLSTKYNQKLEELDKLIQVELSKYDGIVAKWRLTKEANLSGTKTTIKKVNGKTYHYISPSMTDKAGPGNNPYWVDDNGRQLSTQEERELGLEVNLSKSKSEQLETPINLASPQQLAILLYDVLKVPIVDKKSPRGTGEEILKEIDLPICKLIVERRGLMKLINTYIESLIDIKHKSIDGRVHTHFNQYGAATGRFSSSDPINLQNIPSHNKELRMMFKASDGYSLVGGDYSQQEPRILAQFAQDKNMINAYKEKKDLYATIASIVHNNDYWDNMEHYEDGSANPDGKKRRGAIKSVVLGILYGSGPATVAEQITNGRRNKDGSISQKDICTTEEAQGIINKFYQGFPTAKKWIDETHEFALKTGYVEDMFGRRRRLPDLLLPRYDISLKEDKSKKSFNPLLNISESIVKEKPKIVLDYEKQFAQCKSFRDSSSIKKKAEQDGLIVVDNGGFISRAERQCVNATIQGSAASMSKRAMINVYHDKELNELGFRIIIVVHDEIIGECPSENAQRAAKRLSEVMIASALPEVQVPMKCDVEVTKKWYESDYTDVVRKEYKDKQTKMTKEKALESIIQEHTESTKEELLEILKGE